jgi:hypothetical protein
VTLAALGLAAVAGGLARPLQAARPARAVRPRSGPAVVLTHEVRAAFDSIFRLSNRHWNEQGEETQLAQMLGTGRPTQLEYMGCLRGRAAGDTVWVDGTTPARGMVRFQFAVTGSCDHIPDLVGTWHTHPYRADLDGSAIKERHLSATDLKTFAEDADRAVLVVWDVDSIDVAVRSVNGAVQHPAGLVVRPPPLP